MHPALVLGRDQILRPQLSLLGCILCCAGCQQQACAPCREPVTHAMHAAGLWIGLLWPR